VLQRVIEWEAGRGYGPRDHTPSTAHGLARALGADGELRSVRGGAWADTAVPLRVASRAGAAPSEKLLAAGIRCARPATPARPTR